MRKRTEKPSAMKEEVLSEDQLVEEGKIKELFNRVAARKISVWDPGTRSRKPKKIMVADFNRDESLLDDEYLILEQDCLGKYVSGDIEAYIVRVGTKEVIEKRNVKVVNEDGKDEVIIVRDSNYVTYYACEILKKKESLDSFWDDNPFDIVNGLKKEYPVCEIEKKKRGRPAFEMKEEINV